MKSRKLYALFVVFILAVWLVTPTLALAQDEIPPTETPVEVVTEEAPPEITVEEVQEQLPENTELVLLTGDGLEVPLGSTEGDVILASGDPVYCPCGAPLGDPTCGTSRLTFGEALADAQADTSCSWGTIYVESTYVGASANGALVIDADSFFFNDGYSLNILGGIDFTPGPTYGTNIGTSTLQQPLTIRDFDQTIGYGYVHLYDFIIAPPATATNNALNIVNTINTQVETCTVTDISANNAVRIDSSDNLFMNYCDISDTGNGSGLLI